MGCEDMYTCWLHNRSCHNWSAPWGLLRKKVKQSILNVVRYVDYKWIRKISLRISKSS